MPVSEICDWFAGDYRGFGRPASRRLLRQGVGSLRMEKRVIDTPRVELDALLVFDGARYGSELKYWRSKVDVRRGRADQHCRALASAPRATPASYDEFCRSRWTRGDRHRRLGPTTGGGHQDQPPAPAPIELLG